MLGINPNFSRGPKAPRPHVLLVDDDMSFSYVIGRAVRSWKFLCTEAESMSDAMRLVTAEDKFDAVICDCHLPDGSGPELAAWLRSRFPNLPILLVSGLSRPKNTAFDRVDFLAKPFKLDELESSVSRLML